MLFDMYVCLYIIKIYVCIEREEAWRIMAIKIRVGNEFRSSTNKKEGDTKYA